MLTVERLPISPGASNMIHRRLGLVALLSLMLGSTGIAGLAPTEVAAAVGPSSTVISDFDNAWEWHLGEGVATLSTVASPKTSGTGALRIDYNMTTAGAATIVPSGTPAELPGPAPDLDGYLRRRQLEHHLLRDP